MQQLKSETTAEIVWEKFDHWGQSKNLNSVVVILFIKNLTTTLRPPKKSCAPIYVSNPVF